MADMRNDVVYQFGVVADYSQAKGGLYEVLSDL
jgi:hypothetical protein